MPKTPKFLVTAASAIGVSSAGQGLAFVRQLLIAAYFGISREIDVYLIAYALATMIVFTFASTFDSAVVPRLVRIRTERDEGASRALAVSIFGWSAALGIGATVLLIALTPVLTPLVATGFDPAQRDALWGLVLWFAPWTFLCLPYYAAAARHKSVRSFNRVFGAELIIGVASIAFLVLFHDDVRLLPIAYGVGYAAGLVSLLPGAGLLPARFRRSSETKATLRGVGELYLANQSGAVTAIIDRHFQSQVPAGGIAALSYSAQLVSGLVALLTLREIYIVPLSETGRRDEKLERLIIGLLLLAVPIVGLVICFAQEIIYVLFQRGRFDARATELTASVLQVYALTAISSAVTMPLARMLQIVGRTNLIHVMYAASAAALALFGYIFVVRLELGTRGAAWMIVTASFVASGASASLVGTCGVRLRWGRIARYFAYAALVAGLAFSAASVVGSAAGGIWPKLVLGGSAYAAVIGGTYFVMRNRLRTISG
jgi:putative peptidoglycan lipid II flippase